MTLEDILDKIRQEHGLAALRDGNRLMGMFADYSKSQLRPQANALRNFLDCRGNERILNLKDTLGLTQQTEYYRLVQEMVQDYGLQEAIARDVCDAFWRIAAGTEPPILAPESTPIQESAQTDGNIAPASNSSTVFQEPAPEHLAVLAEKTSLPIPDNSVQKPKIAPPIRKPSEKLPWYTIITLVFGFAVLTYLLYGLLVIFMTESEPMMGAITSLSFAVIVLRMQYWLFRKKTVTEAFFEILVRGNFFVCFFVVWFLPSIIFGACGIEALFDSDLFPIEDEATALMGGFIVLSWYYWLWLPTFVREIISGFKLSHEKKKNKRGGTR